MIRVYILTTFIDHGSEHVEGEAFIRDGLLLGTPSPTEMALTQDTTLQEHAGLIVVADSWHVADQAEAAYFTAHHQTDPPDPDYDLICSLLHNSPVPMPYPDLCTAFRLVCKRLGYIF